MSSPDASDSVDSKLKIKLDGDSKPLAVVISGVILTVLSDNILSKCSVRAEEKRVSETSMMVDSDGFADSSLSSITVTVVAAVCEVTSWLVNVCPVECSVLSDVNVCTVLDDVESREETGSLLCVSVV